MSPVGASSLFTNWVPKIVLALSSTLGPFAADLKSVDTSGTECDGGGTGRINFVDGLSDIVNCAS